jgi:hypothetical protein
MPAVSNPELSTFPRDDRLYELYWGGELIQPRPGHVTDRVHLWLVESDDAGENLAHGQIVQITESVGSIPRLPANSYWRNGRYRRPPLMPIPELVHLEIVAPDQWTVVRAGDQIQEDSGFHHTWINPSDKRLYFQTSAGRNVWGHNAKVVVARTTSGQEVVLPCYEIFRAFYAGTSDLSRALIGNTWNAIEKKYIVGSNSLKTPIGDIWHLDLAPGVAHSAVPYLCWMHFDQTCRSAANFIFPSTINQQRGIWISAIPPFVGTTFKITAHVEPLKSRGGYLVNRIVAVHFPLPVASLSYSIARRDIPVVDNSNPEVQHVSDPTQPVQHGNPQTVSQAGDGRQTQRFFSLPSISVKFGGLPRATRSARTERIVHVKKRHVDRIKSNTLEVSVGDGSHQPSPPKAQFTPEEERLIEDKFEEILSLVQDLIDDGDITSVNLYPVVDPAPDGEPTYCRFPYSDIQRPWPWSMVKVPYMRQRLALVLELEVADRLIYWIETETIKKESYRSLAIEMLDGGVLDEESLEALLGICSLNEGIWPDPVGYGEGIFCAVGVRHTRIDGVLARSVFIDSFARLRRSSEST